VTEALKLTPAYRLTVGGKVVDTTEEPRTSTVVSLAVSLDLDTPADSLTLVLGQVDGLRPARGDDVRVELGYTDDDDLTRVMIGTVTAVEAGLTRTRVVAHAGASLFLHATTDRTFESKTAGAIVRDLAGSAGVEVAAADEGINFPAYVVDGRQSLYRHVRDLADLCGFDVYLDPSGKLVFRRFAGSGTVHVFEYAKHLMELSVLETPAPAVTVEAWGESPGLGRGSNAWAWLTKDFGGSKGTSGRGSGTVLLERAALRTAEAAQKAADSAFTATVRREVRGRMVGLGRPQLALGDAVRLSGVPTRDLDQTYQVRSVTHRITKSGGFTTAAEIRSTAGGA